MAVNKFVYTLHLVRAKWNLDSIEIEELSFHEILYKYKFLFEIIGNSNFVSDHRKSDKNAKLQK